MPPPTTTAPSAAPSGPALLADEALSSDVLAQTRRAVRRSLPLLVLGVLLAGGLAGGLSALGASRHVSTVSFVVQSSSGANDTETLIRTMQALVDSEVIGADLATAAGVDLSPRAVADRLSVVRPPGAGVLSVEVSDEDPARSRRLAEELIPAFQRRVDELTASTAASAVRYAIRPWGSGIVTTRVDGSPVVRNTALGLVLGLVVGLLLLAVRAASRPVLLSPAQARAAYGLPLLGALPGSRREGPDPLDALEALLRQAPVGWPREPRTVLVVGSPDVHDRAVLLVDLACALRAVGPVALVDGHGGTGSLTRLLGLRSATSLQAVLAGTTSAPDALHPVGDGETPGGQAARGVPAHASTHQGVLRVLPAGNGRFPAAADGARLPEVVRQLAREHLVVVDAPSLRTPLRWGPIVREVDAVVVLATLGQTRLDEARATGDALQALTDSPVAVLLLEAERLLVPPAQDGVTSPGRLPVDLPSAPDRAPAVAGPAVEAPVAPASPVAAPAQVLVAPAAAGLGWADVPPTPGAASGPASPLVRPTWTDTPLDVARSFSGPADRLASGDGSDPVDRPTPADRQDPDGVPGSYRSGS